MKFEAHFMTYPSPLVIRDVVTVTPKGSFIEITTKDNNKHYISLYKLWCAKTVEN